MIISWNTTKRCNLYCKHCYRDSNTKPMYDELSTKEGLKLIEEIKEAGFKILILSGGEPLIRDDIEIFAKKACEIGLIPVLGTNATLIDKKRAKSLKEAGIKACAVSIDSVDEKKHDDFRGKKGSFKKALEGMKNLNEVGIRIQINSTIRKDNLDEIKSLNEFAIQNKASSHHPFFLVKTGRGLNIGDVFLDEDEYAKAIEEIIELSKSSIIELKPTCAPQFMVEAKKQNINMRFSRGCIAGIKYCCILPNGDVHICPYAPIKVDNVRLKSFDDIWKNNNVFLKLRDFDKYKGVCKACKNIDICGGCRARAYEETKDYMEGDSICKLKKNWKNIN